MNTKPPINPAEPDVTASSAPAVASEQQWLAEQRRRHTLVALGLSPVVSRFDAPGAAPAVRLLAPVVEVSTSAAPARGASTAARTGAADSLHALREQFGESDKAKRPATQAPVVRGESGKADNSSPKVVKETAEAVAFQLLIVAGGGWLWVEALPERLLHNEQLQLVQSMARVLAGSKAQINHRLFDWPLASHPHLPRDINAARQSVAGQLQRLGQETGAKGIIAMGESVQPMLLALPGMVSLSIPATASMLAEPQQKRQAWQVLKPHVING